jgi:hypothetical protein
MRDGEHDVLVQEIESNLIFDSQGKHMQYTMDMDTLDQENQDEVDGNGEGETTWNVGMHCPPQQAAQIPFWPSLN